MDALTKELTARIGIDADELDTQDAGLLWLHNEILKGQGVVYLAVTEDGDIGVFVGNEEYAQGVGDSPLEALQRAAKRWEMIHA